MGRTGYCANRLFDSELSADPLDIGGCEKRATRMLQPRPGTLSP
jgi:hypothetical protein